MKCSAQMAAFQFPGYHPSIDADRRALLLRFGEDCVLVWSNDENCIAVLSDPAMAATATRLIDYGSTSPGECRSTLAAPTVGNVLGMTPWKVVVVAPSVDSWVPDHSPLNLWRGNHGNCFPMNEKERRYLLKAAPNAESRVGFGIADAEGVEETDKLEES